MSSSMRSRRALLTAGGVGGLALLVPGTAHAGPEAELKSAVYGVATVAELLSLDGKKIADGTLVQVAGYKAAGDGGGMLVRWDTDSTAAVNGGTVLGGPGAGRWVQVHDGVGDFRRFGVFGDDAPADAALDAMVNDPSIHRIEAHTDLLFVKRHKYTRSNLEFDFGGHTVRTDGIEKAGYDDPFAAVLFFRGKVTDTVVTAPLTADMPELSDVFEVGDSSKFQVGQWWSAEVSKGAGQWERELQKLVQVTQIVDGSHIRVNYLNGWTLKAGRSITWTRIEPVERVHVRNMAFTGAGADQYTGSHPVAYEYAVWCDVSGIDATGTFWPVVMRRWCTYFQTRSCSLKNPTSVTWGGAGYLTQQIYCLYGHVADCHTSNARHLNDWTASAYGLVENCHGDGDDQGPFVTHGQYEHDLVYTGNSGLMTFANSGAAWGSAAKRITVRRHVCSWFVARVKVTDLTLEDMRVIGKPSLAGSGMIWVNADGVQMRGCSANDRLIISQSSALSARPNVIEGCDFTLAAGSEIVQSSVTSPVHIVRSVLSNLDGNACNGTGELHLVDSTLLGKEGGAPLPVAASLVRIQGGRLSGTGIRLSGRKDQRIHVGGGAVVEGTNGAKALLSRADAGGTVQWELRDYRSTTSDAGTAHVAVETGKNVYSAVGARLSGGKITLAGAAFGDGSLLQHTSCVEEGVARTTPPDGPRVQTTGNLLL
ncbi:hypothetical protein [Microbispora sp. NBRC 16548]|uniref:hypothetical protein n=1 Tax=Microbispora sp. NBRC 16548 TaxID=3030994 RepID=UPI002556C68E|nr:hypothetical protein [Microbispora sp. NBRC 16548]